MVFTIRSQRSHFPQANEMTELHEMRAGDIILKE